MMTELEMTGLLFKLAELGVTGLQVSYDGGGDSGCIEAITYTTEPCETPEDANDLADQYGQGENLANLDQNLYEQIENFAHSTILDDIEDWWNNEGGWGQLCICIPSGKYIVDNHIRITETEDYQHKGDLLSKTDK